jgi:hypothetical protein
MARANVAPLPPRTGKRTPTEADAPGVESGAFFDGRSVQIRENGQTPEKLERKSLKQIANTRESVSRRIERAEPVEAD